MRQLFCVLTAFAVSLSLQIAAHAQTPADVLNPTPDVGDPGGRPDIPDRIQGLDLPQVQFMFDALLDPMRLSLTESVTEQHLNDPRLSEGARSIIRNHMVAMQQVELAIQFLQANREEILSGQNAQFNSVFGSPGQPRDVAVTSPTPLSGFADIGVNLLTGLVELDFDDDTLPDLQGQINVKDFVFVGDAPNADPFGFVAQVEQILRDDDATNQSLLVTPVFGAALNITRANGVPVYKVIRFEQQTDPARFDRVLLTFESIRDAMSGQLPGLPAILQSQGSPITYNRDFTDINSVWLPGLAPFSPLDGLVQNAFNNVPTVAGLTSLRPADRLVRQAGFSNSDSHLHLDRLRDQANGQAVDYVGRPTFPLLWTEDNEIPLQLSNNSPIPGAGDEDRAFFNNQQTIFGEPDNPFTQYVGRAFLEEMLIHAGDFFDTNVEVDPGSLASAIDRARRPQRGNLFDLDGNGTAGNFGDFEQVDVPESGTPTSDQTNQRKWQMIIESFAEHSTDLTRLDVAVFGLGDMFGGFTPDAFRAQDAGNYGAFAGLIGGGGFGGINPARIEPFGKRGGAGFFPVVPRQ
jgi:hypothetical protein